MALTTYAGLQAEVAAWLHRSDLSSTIPTFVTLAIARFNAVLEVPQMEQRASTTLDAEFIELPDDFLSVRYVEIDGGKRLDYVTPEVYARYAGGMARPDRPVYTIADLSLRIYPIQTATPGYIVYLKRIPSLVNSTDTNWLLDQFPQAMLAATLCEGWKYLQSPENVAQWDAVTQQHIATIQRSGRRMNHGAATMIVRAA
jgi:hypothetical protein